jgi:hypothetical protein
MDACTHTNFVRVFSAKGDFEAMDEAETFLSERGFSIGTNQRGAPRGVMFGDYSIEKWRNLNKREISELHGTLVGDGRNGPLTLTIFAAAPDEARRALGKE